MNAFDNRNADLSFFTLYNPAEHGDDGQEDESVKPSDDSSDGSVTVKYGDSFYHCLTVIGQIEGHYNLPSHIKTTKYEHIIPRIIAVEENPDIKGLLLLINTVGGDIEAGLAIAELISGMKKPSVSLVLGGGHSIGIPLAVSATKSYIVPTAAMTVHPVRMNGLVLGVPQTLQYLKKIEERVVNFVTRNSKISSERFCELMLNNKELISDFGSVLNGEEAVREGLIDEVGTLRDATDYLFHLS